MILAKKAIVGVVIIACITVTAGQVPGQAPQQCTFPNGERALCRPLHECRSILRIQESKETSYVLEKFQCDSQDSGKLVCCPESDDPTELEYCIDPNDNPGLCLPIRECTSAMHLMLNHPGDKAAREFLQKANCGFRKNQPKVCCSDDIGDDNSNKPNQERPNHPSQSSVNNGKKKLLSAHQNKGILGVECGVRAEFDHGIKHVTNGANATLSEWPWMVALSHARDEYFCGGTLITNQHVLTAAHCFLGYRKNVKARLGDLNLSEDNDGADPAILRVKKQILHPGFSTYNFTNDIAILLLERPVKFTEYIRAICLPTQADMKINDFLQIAGWGATMHKGPLNPTLQDAVVSVVDRKTCIRKIADIKNNAVIDDTVLCAGNLKPGGADTCKGDSGGPIMDGLEVFYQVGIISYGSDCSEIRYPTVYTKTSAYIGWVVDAVRSLR